MTVQQQQGSSTHIPVRRCAEHAVVPHRAHAGDAGLDLSACEPAVLEPGGRATVGTGIAVAIPHGHVGLVCPRSGLASRHGISVVNGPGVVDSGYRGEVKVVLHNTDREHEFVIEPGDRIAQLVVVPVLLADVVERDDLGDTSRADAGFGSTGVTAASLPRQGGG